MDDELTDQEIWARQDSIAANECPKCSADIRWVNQGHDQYGQIRALACTECDWNDMEELGCYD